MGLLRTPRKIVIKTHYYFLLCLKWQNMIDDFKLLFFQEKLVLVDSDCAWAQVEAH